MAAPQTEEDPVERIQRDLIALGLGGDIESAPALAAYMKLLGRWNTTYNLTGTREDARLRTHHLADCIAAVPYLRKAFVSAPTVRVLDVGSGAGLPGIVLAVLHPSWQVDCIDTIGKKAAFIRQAAGQLNLSNLRAIHARVESVKPADAHGYDLIISRAFSSLCAFVELTRSLLKADGIWVAMKGKISQDELDALPNWVVIRSIEPIEVPGLDADRCLVVMDTKSGINRSYRE